MKKIYYLLLIIFSLANAQNPASIDPTFEFRDYVPQLQLMPPQFGVLSTGKIIAAGMSAYNAYNNTQQTPLPGRFMCLNKDFSVDEAFVQGSGFNNHASAVAVQPDDKVLVGGYFTTYNGNPVQKLARLNSNGTLDNTFQFNSSGFNTFSITKITHILVQPDGKILVGGDFLITKSAVNFIVVDLMRLNADGSIDMTFKSTGNKNVKVIAVQPDGKVLVLLSTGSGINLVRYSASGAVDSSFNTGGGFADLSSTCSTYGYKIHVLQTGKILISGCFSKYNYVTVNGFIRLNTNGTRDATFTPPAGIFLVQPDETLVMIKKYNLDYYTTTTEMIHTDTNGIVQETYTIPIEQHTFLESLQASGANEVVARMRVERVINAQVITYYKFIHLDLQGNLKTEEQKTTHYGGKKILQKSDNEFLILGKIQNRGNRKYHNGIKRISGNGTLAYHDNLFNGPAISALSDPEGEKNLFRDGVLMPDGKLVVLQEYYSGPSNNTQYFKLIRYNTDFSLDTTFNYLSADIRAMLALPDGKLLIAYGNHLERLNTDGSIDNSFQINADFNGSIYTMKLLGNGQILVGGGFSSYLNAPAGRIARLNPDGSLDTSFNASGIWAFVSAIDLQSDGKIIIGGKLYQNQGTYETFNLARLNSDGSLDNSFVKDLSTSNRYPRQVVVQPDNKILIIQQPQQYTTADCEVKRFNSDGTLDATFDTGSGFTGGEVNSILLQADGRIIVAGEFTKYNGIFCNGSVRLTGNQSFVIQGQNRLDVDNSGCDAADPVFPNLKLHVASADGGMDFIPDVTGNYAVTVPPGNFTITPVFENNAFLNSMPANASVSFPTQVSPFAQDFCLSANGTHHDLEITLLPLNTARPGFDAEYKIVYHNKGNQVESGTISLSFNGDVTDFVSGVPEVNSQTSNTLNWNFSDLKPFESKEFIFILNLNTPMETPPVNASMLLEFTTSISSTAADETPADNTFILKQIVFNSYDPNDKTCLEGDSIPVEKVGEFVHYMIRFENTGTFAAQNVVVEDFIDTDKFDLSSLMPVSGSHLYTTKIQSGRVQFVFNNINLPFDDANNDGYVAFKIKTKASLVAGDAFSNAASIYFDYNAAIHTNTANTVVQTIPGCAVTLTSSLTNVNCFGGSNGTATIVPDGGLAPYSYLWSNGETTATITGLATGTYTVTVLDDAGCTATGSVTITQPALLNATAGSQTNIACNGGTTGSATVAVTGGTPGYTYSWAPLGGTTDTATGLAAGTYTVTVTDANGCMDTQAFTITEPTVVNVTAGTQVNVSCNGGADGSATVAVTGGTGAYTYSWAPSGGTAATATGLAAGTYTVTVTDANGCVGTQAFTITQPTVVNAIAGTQVNVSCNGGADGSVTVAVTGGTGAYTYTWAPSGGTAATATGLTADTYTVTVTDANGCMGTQAFTITEPTVVNATAGTQVNVSCNGGADGSATVAVTGGTGAYTYSWAPSGGTAPTATGLTAGTYTVTVTDANGCMDTQAFTITEPTVVNATAGTQVNVSCNGSANGSATVAVTGGTGAYTYTWAPSGGTAPTAIGLTAGTYTVTVTDANGCSATQSVTITQPEAIIIDVQPTDVSTTTGGNAAISVDASNVDTYQWQVSTNGTDWTDIADGGTDPEYAGVTTDVLTLIGIPLGFDGNMYRVVLVNGDACSTISGAAMLSVDNIILAVGDDLSAIVINQGVGGVAGDVTLNDMLNGAAVNDIDVILSMVDNDGVIGAMISATGVLTIPAVTPEGTYTLTYSICEVANPSNCSSAEVTVVVSPPLNVKDIRFAGISVYPNPASSEVFIRIPDIANHKNAKVYIYDVNGRMVKQQELNAVSESVDVRSLEDAVYILKITTDLGKTTIRIVKKQ